MSSAPTASRRESFLAILLIVFTTLVTYGTLISQLGFYRDDWYLLWAAKSRGMEGLLNLFQGDRPFMGWMYTFDFSIVGLSPLAWHLYALCIKLLSAFIFLWLVRSIWPNLKTATLFVTLLFIVYPGFYEQPNALTYKQDLISYAATLASLALTVNAIKTEKTSRKAIFTVLAVLLSALYVLIYEVLIGTELVRVLLIWYLFWQQGKNWKECARLTFVNLLPYLVFPVLFVYWRFFIFVSTRKATSVDVIIANYTSLRGISGLLIEGGKDLVETSIFAWAVPFYQFAEQVDYKIFLKALGLGLLVVMAGAGYYLLVRKQLKVQDGTETDSPRDMLILGSLFVFVTTIPIIAAGRNVNFGEWDRYSYPSVLGAALFMGGMIFYVFKGKTRWVLLSALLVSGVMVQYINASYFRDYWMVERNAWWQLSWRAPQIKDGTTIVLALPGGFGLAEEYEVWGPANLIYQPVGELRLPGQVMYDQIWIDLLQRTQQNRLVRDTFTIPRDFGKVIILSQSSPNTCLHVLDGKRSDQAITEARTDVRFIAQYSDVGLIESSPQAIPPAVIFGSEPPHNWCYFYEKMDLARQTNDWKSVIDLAHQAKSSEVKPADVSEWLPVLEAYVQLNDLEHAKQIAGLIRDDKDSFNKMCAQYVSIKGQPAKYDRDTVYEALCKK